MTASHTPARTLLLLTLLAASAGPIVAAEQPLWGYGVRPCTDYQRAATAADAGDMGEYLGYQDWLAGFLSGLNLATGTDVLRGLGVPAALTQIRAGCEARPDSDFFNAAMELVRARGAID